MRRSWIARTASTAVVCLTCTLAPVGTGVGAPWAVASGVTAPIDTAAQIDTAAPSPQVRVLVAIAGEPVAVQVSERDPASSPRVARIRQRALAELAPVEAAVAQLGGTVRGRFVDAVRMLAVSVPVDSVAALHRVPRVRAVEVVQVHRGARARSWDSSATSSASMTPASRIFGTAPAPWATRGLTGRGVKIAILDSGIDYTHADFGGPGTVEAYKANDGTVIEPGTFPTAKVIAGYDFVGDAYDADSAEAGARVPVPDPDPLDCEGHGTHVAGTAAGFGVTATGSTFTGPYQPSAMAGLAIAPGSAPQALLMAYRVFGCDGDNDSEVVVASIDRAVRDGADVINMSMGREFGTAGHMEALASDGAVRAGVVVIASAGNSGPEPYLVGSPSTGTRVLSIAALDDVLSNPGGALLPAAAGGPRISVLLANDGTVPVDGPVRVLRDASGAVSLGCTANDYAGTTGAIVVVARGVCPRVDRPAFAEAAGARAVIMLNDANQGYPPIEGAIDGVRIPFFGARLVDKDALTALNGLSRVIEPTLVLNDTGRKPTTFTSAGPRTGDSGVKPNLAGPGAAIVSAKSGSGSQLSTLSGTSMSAPFVAGVAAVVRQAHPDWTAEQASAAIAVTASVSPRVLKQPNRSLTGAGVVAPVAAVQAPVLVLGPSGGYGVSFGVRELTSPATAQGNSTVERIVRVWNPGTDAITVRLDVRVNGPLRARFSVVPQEVTLAPGQGLPVRVRMTPVPQAEGSATASSGTDGAAEVPLAAATLVATTAGHQGVRLLMQGLILDRSDITGRAAADGSMSIANRGRVTGAVEPFTWVLADDRDPTSSADLRAIGVRSDPAGNASSFPGDRLITFAINQYERFSNPARARYTVNIDSDGDGRWDHAVLGVDEEFFATGNDEKASFNGVMTTQAIDLAPNGSVAAKPVVGEVDAPMNGSTVLLTVPASAIGISGANQQARISVESVSYADPVLRPDTTPAVVVNAWQPGPDRAAVQVKPGQAASIAGDVVRGDSVAPLGTMLVTLSNASGPAQARLFRARTDLG